MQNTPQETIVNPKRHWILRIKDWAVIYVVFGTILTLGLCAGLVIQMVDYFRTELRLMDDQEGLRQIAGALISYEQTYQSFPPAYTVDDAGNKLHSWRTLLLPYMDEAAIYQRIDLTKPWDAPENAEARSYSISWFHSHDLPPEHTCYRAFIDPNGVFSGASPCKLSSISDGVNNTILFAQAAKNQSVHWMQPDDYALTDFLYVTPSESIYGRDFTLAVFCDGTIRRLAIPPAEQEIKAFISIDGNESVPPP